MASADCVSRLPACSFDVALEYEALKRRLAQEHYLDREAYTEAKRPFINQITEMALKMAEVPGHFIRGMKTVWTNSACSRRQLMQS